MLQRKKKHFNQQYKNYVNRSCLSRKIALNVNMKFNRLIGFVVAFFCAQNANFYFKIKFLFLPITSLQQTIMLRYFNNVHFAPLGVSSSLFILGNCIPVISLFAIKKYLNCNKVDLNQIYTRRK